MIGKTYRHFKGNLYKVLNIAYDTETLEEMVVYEALYDEHKVWVRSKKDFLSKVDKVKYPNIKQENRFVEV